MKMQALQFFLLILLSVLAGCISPASTTPGTIPPATETASATTPTVSATAPITSAMANRS